jgi:hypothetical protein
VADSDVVGLTAERIARLVPVRVFPTSEAWNEGRHLARPSRSLRP